MAAGTGFTALIDRVPLGPVLAIGPFNFPLNLLVHKVAPALGVKLVAQPVGEQT
jgi:acyl-CoA reductase-like NAD-dependent aldehyde dehydrogenase